jgi:hypothetical protein
MYASKRPPRASLALRPCTLMINLDDSPTVHALSRPPSLASVTNMGGPYRLSILPAGEANHAPRRVIVSEYHVSFASNAYD